MILLLSMLFFGIMLVLVSFMLWVRGIVPGWASVLGSLFGLDVVESAISNRYLTGESVELE